MTLEQKKAIEELRQQYNQNCKAFLEYGSNRICNFHIYENEEPQDDNITVIITRIDDLTNDYQPIVKVVNILVEPDGTHFNLADLFPASKVVKYVQKLKKIA